MKTKIYKIFGVALALVLVVGLAGAFIAPTHEAEAQAYTPNQWNIIGTPTPGGGWTLAPGIRINNMAVGPDGATIYVVSNIGIWKSTSAGAAFAPIPNPAGFAAPGLLTAVAPDDPSVAGIVDTAGQVWITNNGGSTWSNLSPVVTPWGALGEIVSDLQVSSARTGPLLGRDYAVCTFHPAGPMGNIWRNSDAAWINVTGLAGVALDWSSIELAPNWVGDRVVLGFGSNLAADPNAPIGATLGDSFLVSINCGVTPPVLTKPPVPLDAGAQDSPAAVTGGLGVVGGEIWFSDIAVPSDFDSTSVGGWRAYVGWTSVPAALGICGDDAYRVDFNAVRKLEVRPIVPLFSLSYFGTLGAGTLMVGEANTTLVWTSSDPYIGSPNWGVGTAKPPTGVNRTNVHLTSETDAFLVTTGAQCGVHRTADAGLSWDGISLLDEIITAIDDVMPTPDGSVVFMSTDNLAGLGPDGAPASGDEGHSLWRGTGLPNPGGWERIHYRNGPWVAPPARQFTGTRSLIRLSPEYGTDSTVYWFDSGPPAGAPPTTASIRRSTSGGQMFSGRTAPVPNPTLPADFVWDACVENADILYVTDLTGNVYASTNGGWFFGLPINPGIAAINDIAMAPSYPSLPVPGHVLAGAAGAGIPPAISTDSNASWRPLLAPIGGAVLQQIIADTDYANNNTVYLGSFTPGQGIYRYEIGTSSAWEQIDPFPAYVTVWGVPVFARLCTGLAMIEGTSILYGSWIGAAAVNSGADRSLVPELPVIASWVWDSMDAGTTPGAPPPVLFLNPSNALRADKRGASVDLWVIDIVGPNLYAYEDTMALAELDVSVPDEVEASLAETARGWNAQFSVSWGIISNATDYDVQIATDPGMANVVFAAPAAGVVTPPWFIPANPLSPTIVVAEGTLVAGHDYFVRIRARDQTPNDAIRSNWSSVHRFTVQGGEVVEVPYLAPQPLAPTCGSTGNPRSPGFTWSPYAKSTRYEFQLAADPAFTSILAEGKVSTTGFAYEGTLDYEGTYFWRVRAIEPTTSGWSPVCAFTVEKKEVAPPPPVEIVQPPPPEPVVTAPVIWAIIGIGAILVIAVIVLIVRTRRAA